MVVKDRRILLCHEALGGIKTLKMQAWEEKRQRALSQERTELLSTLIVWIHYNFPWKLNQ